MTCKAFAHYSSLTLEKKIYFRMKSGYTLFCQMEGLGGVKPSLNNHVSFVYRETLFQ